jgi:DNA-binding PucR family transcriptional regulator
VVAAAKELGLPCGYGSPVPLGQLAQGVSQARAALELADGQGGVVGPSGLLSLEGLLEQQPAARLEPFVDQLVAPLLASDTDRGTGHMATLRSFLATNGSLQATAREQYLHVNTVRHRLARVRDLTGRDPLVFADRVALAIALWAYDRRDPA